MGDFQDDEVNYEEQYDEEYEEQENEASEEDLKKRIKEMDEELESVTKNQLQVEKQINSISDSIDENSIYVGQVDYEATPDELRAHFAPCGSINRITIMVDKITGQAKGFAYVEFVDKESVENALKLDDTQFKGRNLKVLPKRQNVPQAVRGGRFGGRGRGRFGGRGGRGGFRGRSRGSFRGRGRGAYYNSYY